MRHPNLLGRFYEQPLFVTEGMAQQIEAVLLRGEDGIEISQAEIEALIGPDAEARNRPNAVYYQGQQEGEYVAQIPLYGVLVNRGNLLTRASGMTSYLDFANMMREAADNPAVQAIVLDVDSPGGEVGGTGVASEAVVYARERVPVIAVANDQMASAAYLVASHADQIVVSDSSMVGSIGVVLAHKGEDDGKTTYIHAGKAKVDGVAPLTEESKARLQTRVDEAYLQFCQKVAENRNLSVNLLTGDSQDGIADGSLYWGPRAIELGLADDRGTIHDVITALLTPETDESQMSEDELGVSEEQAQVPEGDLLSGVEAEESELVSSLSDQLDRVLEENQRLTEELEAMRLDKLCEEATKLVDAAIREGRIVSGARERLIDRAIVDYEAVSELLGAIPRGSVVPVGETPIAANPDRADSNIETYRQNVRKQLRGEE